MQKKHGWMDEWARDVKRLLPTLCSNTCLEIKAIVTYSLFWQLVIVIELLYQISHVTPLCF